MEKSLSVGIKRGFAIQKLKKNKEPKVKEDQSGYYIYTVNEGVKVYFEDFYAFLEEVEKRCSSELRSLKEKVEDCDLRCEETRAYYCARKIIVEVILKNVYGYYGDDSSFAVIMTPWCFGTVILEKVENYKERLSRGKLPDVNLPEYPYLVLRYIDEIYKKTLLELLELPPEAFSIKWQYTELLKRFSKVFSDVYANLADIFELVTEYN
ncbi:MAG: hypothetical protein AMJ91_01675 [candidate division Zixibacteria bacterium SM23_73_3]|nr:MAG: hypothetical protein AMJ91_01675 [candidate division Zixibacteria bacterium SM23_73_3]